VKTLPNSFVHLLGVDQSVLILKSGNDVNKELLFSELVDYENANRQNIVWDNYVPYDDFSVTNTLVLTNTNLPFRKFSLVSSRIFDLKINFCLL
jgi:CD109 antigen